MVVEGYIDKIIYQNEENGYTVFQVETQEGDEIFVGNVPGAAEGMYIQAEGDYVHHPQYDLQFSVSECELSMPDDTEGITRFLGSGIIKGIGEALAKRIVKKFQGDTLRIIEEEPERLAEVRGISENMAERIAVRYSENRSYRNVIMFLSKYGISVKNSMKIYSEFGDEVYNVIRTNPYKIADYVPGIGFKTVDDIAMQAGISSDSEFRVSSAILYILSQSMSFGHMYIPEKMLAEKAYELLTSDMPREDFDERIHSILLDMSMNSKVLLKEEDGETICYLYWNYKLELDSARRILELRFDYDTEEREIEEVIDRVETDAEIELAPEQKNAVKLAVSSGVSVITGGPGTGKTTIINAIIKYFECQAKVALLAAPTGRAAKRITESTGYNAQTIHRLLEFSGEPGDDGSKTVLRFGRNNENPLECDAVIIDEASMVDANLFYALLRAIGEGTSLILVGDTDQLPPVGAGNVLHDIIASDCFPVTILNKIYRQSDGSSIVENAHKIRNGEHLEINNKSKDFFFIPRMNSADIAAECNELVLTNLPKYLNVSPLDIEVIAPMRHYELGVEELNKRLQKTINPPSKSKREKEKGNVVFREGDKIMQIKNNYKIEWTVYTDKSKGIVSEQGIGVFNGDMGIITEINDFDENVEVTFDDGRVAVYEYNQLDELEHSYAITVHKSQGSEYSAVVLPILSGPPKLLNRNLLYTAVTRAKNMVVIVGNLNKINDMIDNTTEQKRYTGFTKRIQEMAEISEKQEYMSFFMEDDERETDPHIWD
ncbi:MAG: ATP-dependent RecD-like DNA helicase [Eubacterium sp.]|nr:ATP-dependent RecD-like DNA helicase [Eubacterium sp.]